MLFGLRVGRVREFSEVLAVEGRGGVWKVLVGVLGGGWSVLRGGGGRVERSEEARRRYGVCLRCPIMDRKLRRCRRGPGEGCGCYLPYRVLVDEPCWIWRESGGVLGWGDMP